MGSSRLPGKAMLDLDGKPVIQHVLERANDAILVDEVVLATTWGEEDDVLAAKAEELGYRSHAGPTDDVLRRVLETAERYGAERVVRLTGDCPMLHPPLIDRVISALGRSDFASNVIRRTFPKGLDCEAMHLDTLKRIDRLATSEKARASVTWFAYKEKPELFVIESVEQPTPWRWAPEMNLCVDTSKDLERLRNRTRTGDFAVPY